MPVRNDVEAYPGTFVIGVETIIVAIDPDEDNDLKGCKAEIMYQPNSRSPYIPWPVRRVEEINSHDSNGKPIVKGLIIFVTPVLVPEPPGCLGWFFRKRRKPKSGGDDGMESTTGTLSGTLNPPPPPPSPGGLGNLPLRRPRDFKIYNPVLYVGIET